MKEYMEQKILKATEEMVREGGYNAFSFRDIAKKVGIKSSSVHYHFPTKADLGAAVARYYTEKFMNNLGAPEDIVAAKKDPLEIYIQAFKSALTKDKRMCLCGMLGAEINSLPPEVAAQTKVFFKKNIEWLSTAHTIKHGEKDAQNKALQALSLLEGAMIMSNVLDDIEIFDKAASLLTTP